MEKGSSISNSGTKKGSDEGSKEREKEKKGKKKKKQGKVGTLPESRKGVLLISCGPLFSEATKN